MMLGFGLVGFLIMALILGALLLGSLAVVRGLFPLSAGKDGPSKTMGARELLDQRYARGEISRDEYETIRQDLQG